MKRVLLISNAFPPLPGGGVLRPSRMAKYLSEWGWTPIVLTMTVPADLAQLGEPAVRFAEHVIRCPRLDPGEMLVKAKRQIARLRVRWLGARPSSAKPEHAGTSRSQSNAAQSRLSNYIFVPDIRVLWIPGAILAGLAAILRWRPSTIFSMSPDPSAHLVAFVLAKLTGCRWVAEFRDPWISNPFRCPRPVAFIESIDRALERIVITGADHIVVTSVEYKDDFVARYRTILPEKISFVPNGFDPADFDDVERTVFPRMTILHAGNFYSIRSSAPFLTAFSQLLERRPDLRPKLQVAFVGTVDAEGLEVVKAQQLQENVSLMGHKPHRETLRLMCGADILLLVPGAGNGTMPGKTYEYLRAQRPILCLGEEGPAARLIRRAEIGIAVAANDIGKIAQALEQLMHQIETCRFDYEPVKRLLPEFDRRQIAGKIAGVCELADPGTGRNYHPL